jgi:hypothetical protein
VDRGPRPRHHAASPGAAPAGVAVAGVAVACAAVPWAAVIGGLSPARPSPPQRTPSARGVALPARRSGRRAPRAGQPCRPPGCRRDPPPGLPAADSLHERPPPDRRRALDSLGAASDARAVAVCDPGERRARARDATGPPRCSGPWRRRSAPPRLGPTEPPRRSGPMPARRGAPADLAGRARKAARVKPLAPASRGSRRARTTPQRHPRSTPRPIRGPRRAVAAPGFAVRDRGGQRHRSRDPHLRAVSFAPVPPRLARWSDQRSGVHSQPLPAQCARPTFAWLGKARAARPTTPSTVVTNAEVPALMYRICSPRGGPSGPLRGARRPAPRRRQRRPTAGPPAFVPFWRPVRRSPGPTGMPTSKIAAMVGSSSVTLFPNAYAPVLATLLHERGVRGAPRRSRRRRRPGAHRDRVGDPRPTSAGDRFVAARRV